LRPPQPAARRTSPQAAKTIQRAAGFQAMRLRREGRQREAGLFQCRTPSIDMRYKMRNVIDVEFAGRRRL
jgi:hypothetical protein